MNDSIEDLIAEFAANPDMETNRTTAERLEARAVKGLSLEESAALLRAAARDYERPPDRFIEPRGQLVWAVVDHPREELVPIVRETFGRLATEHDRVGALRLLANIGTREAEHAILELSLRHRHDEVQPGIWFAWAGDDPSHPDVLFPDVLELMDDPEQRWSVLSLLLGARASGVLSGADVAGHADVLAGAARDERRKLRRRQREEPGDWCWRDAYAEARTDVAMLLDLLGHCGGPAAVEELRAALGAYTDPQLRAWATASLVRLEEGVDAAEIVGAAERAETRSIIARALDEHGRLEELPAHLRTQAAFAEAEMVDWLVFPTELGRPPDALELEAPIDAGDHGTMYLFRFLSDGKWYAGVAGPYPAGREPVVDGGGMTFSAFEPWDARSPGEHAQAIVDALPR